MTRVAVHIPYLQITNMPAGLLISLEWKRPIRPIRVDAVIIKRSHEICNAKGVCKTTAVARRRNNQIHTHSRPVIQSGCRRIKIFGKRSRIGNVPMYVVFRQKVISTSLSCCPSSSPKIAASAASPKSVTFNEEIIEIFCNEDIEPRDDDDNIESQHKLPKSRCSRFFQLFVVAKIFKSVREVNRKVKHCCSRLDRRLHRVEQVTISWRRLAKSNHSSISPNRVSGNDTICSTVEEVDVVQLPPGGDEAISQYRTGFHNRPFCFSLSADDSLVSCLYWSAATGSTVLYLCS